MAPLICNPYEMHRAVFLITTPISFGVLEVSQSSYKLLARHVGMSLNSVSHWAVCVIDRGLGECYCYDLMSDRLELTMLGKNYFRVAAITPEFVNTWSSCYYIGETTKTHHEIQEIGKSTAPSPVVWYQSFKQVIDISDAILGIRYYQITASTWSTVSSRNYVTAKLSVKQSWMRNYLWPHQRLRATCL